MPNHSSSSKPYSETTRLWVHVSMIGFALLIGRWPASYIVLLALAALLFNIFLLPFLTRRSLEREEDRALGFSPGLLLYPFSVLALSLLFYDYPIFIAIGWTIMAFGDPAAHVIGKNFPLRPLPWNREKSAGGFLGFLLIGCLSAIGFLSLLPDSLLLQSSSDQWLIIIITGVVLAGLIETIPGLIDDNLSVPLSGAGTAFGVYMLFQFGAPVFWPVGSEWAAIAMGVFMGAAIYAKKIDVPGGICGGLIGMGMYLGAGIWGVLYLILFFVMGTVATSWKMKEKLAGGLAEKDKGRRSVSNALSNGGVAGLCGYLAWLFPDHAVLFQTMMAASMASATADTLASELGNVYGKQYVDIWTWKKGTRGHDGVISLEGTFLGSCGAILLAALHGLSLHSFPVFLIVASAGMLGNFLDSLLGATLQRHGFMNNHTVNFANTTLAAVYAASIYLFSSPH